MTDFASKIANVVTANVAAKQLDPASIAKLTAVLTEGRVSLGDLREAAKILAPLLDKDMYTSWKRVDDKALSAYTNAVADLAFSMRQRANEIKAPYQAVAEVAAVLGAGAAITGAAFFVGPVIGGIALGIEATVALLALRLRE
jgi:hypothetical protein